MDVHPNRETDGWLNQMMTLVINARFHLHHFDPILVKHLQNPFFNYIFCNTQYVASNV